MSNITDITIAEVLKALIPERLYGKTWEFLLFELDYLGFTVLPTTIHPAIIGVEIMNRRLAKKYWNKQCEYDEFPGSLPLFKQKNRILYQVDPERTDLIIEEDQFTVFPDSPLYLGILNKKDGVSIPKELLEYLKIRINGDASISFSIEKDGEKLNIDYHNLARLILQNYIVLLHPEKCKKIYESTNSTR